MDFLDPLISGKLVKRYKRFMADVTLENGDIVTAHCANTGAMIGVQEPGSEVWLSPALTHGRHSLDLVGLLHTDNKYTHYLSGSRR